MDIKEKEIIIEELKKDTRINNLFSLCNLSNTDISINEHFNSNKSFAILVNVCKDGMFDYTVNYNHHKLDNDVVRAERLKKVTKGVIA